MAVGYALGRRFLVLTTSVFNQRLVIRRDTIEWLEEVDEGTWINSHIVHESLDEILDAMERDV